MDADQSKAMENSNPRDLQMMIFILPIPADQLNAKLPNKYAGVLSFLRQEVRSHSREMRGIFRIRQSKRVDQLITIRQDDKS